MSWPTSEQGARSCACGSRRRSPRTSFPTISRRRSGRRGTPSRPARSRRCTGRRPGVRRAHRVAHRRRAGRRSAGVRPGRARPRRGRARRLNEHAVHSWDVDVTLEPSAVIPADAAAVIVDNLGLIAGFSGRAIGSTDKCVHVRTSEPVRDFALTLGADAVSLTPCADPHAPDLELPADALIRLVYGRLDPDHTPAASRASTSRNCAACSAASDGCRSSPVASRRWAWHSFFRVVRVSARSRSACSARWTSAASGPTSSSAPRWVRSTARGWPGIPMHPIDDLAEVWKGIQRADVFPSDARRGLLAFAGRRRSLFDEHPLRSAHRTARHLRPARGCRRSAPRRGRRGVDRKRRIAVVGPGGGFGARERCAAGRCSTRSRSTALRTWTAASATTRRSRTRSPSTSTRSGCLCAGHACALDEAPRILSRWHCTRSICCCTSNSSSTSSVTNPSSSCACCRRCARSRFRPSTSPTRKS